LLLACIGILAVGIEVFIVNRVRLRNPLYRVRDFSSDAIKSREEISRFKAEVQSLYNALNQELYEYEQAIVGDKQGLREPDLLLNANERRQYRERLRIKEKDLCDLMSDFRGFFYALD